LIVIDANLLLYAYDASAAEHLAASAWLNQLFESGETIGLPWVAIWAFIRVSTNPRLLRFPRPLSEIFSVVSGWLDEPDILVLTPGPRHMEILERLVAESGAGGPLVTDAVIAALAIEYGATVASTDQDFRRFPEVRWVNPLRD
jgi:toxin-antitoxin system PIN domain toxin